MLSAGDIGSININTVLISYLVYERATCKDLIKLCNINNKSYKEYQRAVSAFNKYICDNNIDTLYLQTVPKHEYTYYNLRGDTE